MSDNSEKKSNHPIFVNVVSMVLAGVILLVCTTIYNLVLAHIWPVTIHFGEYSLNNFIFVVVSIVSSVLVAVIILSLEMFYVLNSLVRAIFNFGTPPDKRKKRRHQWFEYILDAFLLAAAGVLSLFIWLATLKGRKEEVQGLLTKAFSPSIEQKPEQKQEQHLMTQEHIQPNEKEE